MKDNWWKNLPLLLVLAFIFGPIFGKGGIIFFLAVLVVIMIFYKFKKSHWRDHRMSGIIDLDRLGKYKSMDTVKTKKIVLLTAIIIFGLWLFFASIQIVDAGETGVYSLFGKVRGNELRSGFHLVIPLAKVTRMSVRTEEYTMSIAQGEGKRYGTDAIVALTKEGLSVDLDMTVLYHLDEEKASDIYKNVGLNYEDKIIRPAIRTAIRDVIAQYEAKDIYSEKRQEAAQKIHDELVDDLGSRGIILETVLLRNVQLPSTLSNAIQSKLEAEQEAEKYDFILAKEKKEKQRKIIEAEGQRDAQKIINESLSQNYLYYLYIKDLKDREGTIYVPTNPSTGMPLFRDLGR